MSPLNKTAVTMLLWGKFCSSAGALEIACIDAADLIYDPATGDDILDSRDTPTGVIVAFGLEANEGRMIPNDSLDPFGCVFIDCVTINPRIIGAADLSSQGLAIIPVGPILPTGMSVDELASFFDSAVYAYTPGSGGEFELCVPEPTSGVFLHSIAILAAIGHRRIRTRRSAVTA